MKNTFTLHINDLKKEYSDRFNSPFLKEMEIDKLLELTLSTNQEKSKWDKSLHFDKKDWELYLYSIKNMKSKNSPQFYIM